MRYNYEILNDDTLRLTFYFGIDSVLSIPASIDGHPVSTIGCELFRDDQFLTKITLPDGITTIEPWAFSNCSRLEEINLPESIISIGKYAFYECLSLKKISLPEKLTEIEERAFFRCEELESITIPDSVTKIASGAFMGCRRLSELVIPESVSKIGERAFAVCGCLTDVVFPHHEVHLGGHAFDWCVCLKNIRWSADLLQPYLESDVFSDCYTLTSHVYHGEYAYEITSDSAEAKAKLLLYIGTDSKTMLPDFVDGYPVAQISADIFHSALYQSATLKEICVQESNPYYVSRDGVLYSKDFSTLVCYPCGKENSVFQVPDSVSIIGKRAFSLCRYLRKVELPSALEVISERAFDSCNLLCHMHLPNGIKTIGDYAFSDTNLKNIDIPDSVSCLAKYALYEESREEWLTEAALTEVDDQIRREKGFSVPGMILNGLERKAEAWMKRYDNFVSMSYDQVTFEKCDSFQVITAGLRETEIEYEGHDVAACGTELVIYCPDPIRVTDENVSEWLTLLSEYDTLYIQFHHLFDTHELTTMGRTFSGASIEKIDDDWDLDLGGVQDLSELFSECEELYKADLRKMNFSGATTVQGMFRDCSRLYSVNMSRMDLHQVKDLSEMFLDCSNLKEVDFSYADLSSAENLDQMFEGCESLRKVNWNGVKLPPGISVLDLPYGA